MSGMLLLLGLCIMTVIQLTSSQFCSCKTFSEIQDVLNEIQTDVAELNAENRPNTAEDCQAAGFTHISSVNGCYKLVNRNLEWEIAGLVCRSLHKDAHLLVINDEQEQSAVAGMLASTNPSTLAGCFTYDSSWGRFFWIAGQRIDTTRSSPFVWRVKLTKAGDEAVYPLTYTNFETGQPNGGAQSSCMSLSSGRSYKWHDWVCTRSSCFVCEIDI